MGHKKKHKKTNPNLPPTTGNINSASEKNISPDNESASEEKKEFPLTTDRYQDRKSTRLNSSHIQKSRMPSSA